MTAEEEFRLLQKTAQELEELAIVAYLALSDRIRRGEDPGEAVAAVLQKFSHDYEALLAAGLVSILDVTLQELGPIEINGIRLSDRLYSNAQAVSAVVQGVVQNHRRGFQDARKLALELYEGYQFRPEEVLRIVPGEARLPRYLDDLIQDRPTQQALDKAFLRAQKLQTSNLRAAYLELLNKIQDVESAEGAAFLDKKLKVAFQEKVRYYANRIAITELHRAFAIEQALELMNDTAVEYVQWRLNPRHPVDDICDYFAGVNRYGLGSGVYPKRLAPVAPAHPHCRCVLSPRLDLGGKTIKELDDADENYFRSLPQDIRRKVAGSREKLARILSGEDPWDVHNSNIDPIYQVKTVQDVI